MIDVQFEIMYDEDESENQKFDFIAKNVSDLVKKYILNESVNNETIKNLKNDKVIILNKVS